MKKQYLMLFVFFVSTLLVAQEKGNVKNTSAVKSTVAKNIDVPHGAIKNNSTTAGATYDFTTGSDKYYGGAAGAVELETDVWGMVAGDANADGGVYAEDYTSYQTNQGQENYNDADFNMDGGVYAEDYTLYQINQGKETQVPN